jgi:predicted AAA+ superfamily ATPase
LAFVFLVVAAGRYRQAEFAADLADVLAGAAEAEYKDPFEFLSRTQYAEGMRLLPTTVVHPVVGVSVSQLLKADGGSKGGVEFGLTNNIVAMAWPEIERKAAGWS